MKILIIFAHPNEQSFCAAIRERLIEGLLSNKNLIKIHNLYQEDFYPLLVTEELRDKKAIEKDKLAMKYQKEIDWAEYIIIIHPSWWYGVPAILKGYFDRLLTEGFSYNYVVDHPEPKFSNKKGIVIQTFDGEEKQEKESFDDTTFKSVYYPWKYCGIEEWQKVQFFRVNFITEEKRKKWLEEIFALGIKIGLADK